MNIISICLIFLTIAIKCRYFETEFKFTVFGKQKGWVYLDKMAFEPGIAEVEFETKTTGMPYGQNSQVFLTIIPEQLWEQQIQKRCQAQFRKPLIIHQMPLDGTSKSSYYKFQITDYTLYYFVLKDCQSRYINDYNNTNLKLHVKIHMVNNGKQLGEEEDHWYIVPFIIAAGICLVYYYMNEARKDPNAPTDWAKMLLFAGTATQISSLCWRSFGFLLYHYTGSDYVFFHFIYLLLHSTSQSAVLILLTLIAFGWTLTYMYGEQFDMFLPVIGVLGFINIVITIVTKLGHSHDRHHIFDTVGGNILLIFRITVVLTFIGGCIYTYQGVRHKLKQFLIKFSFFGFFYVASMPLTVFFANYFISAKDRHQFVFITVEIIKFTTNLVLAYMINSKKSQYNSVNYKSSSFLPDDEKFF